MNLATPDFTAYIDRITQQLDLALESHPAVDSLKTAMSYSLLGGGKRFRAILVYAIGDWLQANEHLLNQCACAIEMIHAFSLIHDDLPAMDDDILRRGQATCHVKFNEATAILAGDALQTLAFEVLSRGNIPEKQLAMVHCLAKASGAAGMAGGQWLDVHPDNEIIDIVSLEHMHQLKTGCLIEVAAQLAWLASDNDNTNLQRGLIQYARYLGLAFQIYDDVLDATSCTETLGKSSQQDQRHHKITYVSLLGLERAKNKAAETADFAKSAINEFDPPDFLLELADWVVSRQN